MGETIEAVTLDRKHHTIYMLGIIYCETMLKGKGIYNHALKIVEHLGKHFTQPIHEVTPQPLESSPTALGRLQSNRNSKLSLSYCAFHAGLFTFSDVFHASL